MDNAMDELKKQMQGIAEDAEDKKLPRKRTVYRVRIRKMTNADTAEIELMVYANCLTDFLELMCSEKYHVKILNTLQIRS